MRRAVVLSILLAVTAAPAAARAGYERTFEAGSLIIPMDLAYQDVGMFQAYGLVFQLLRQGITVYWVIDPEKTWHDSPCDTAGDECLWDCAEEGSGVRCPYPTASPDFFASAQVVWDDQGTLERGDPIGSHGYRGGPFVIDAADHDAALAIVDAWNDPATWGENAWADRTVVEVVSVHEATAAFDGYVRKEMNAAPTIAVFSDGNEDIATGYLRAAGIPQSNGAEYPAGRCAAGACGPGTDNPDMLTVESIMGDMGTCDAPNLDHRNGALFTADGVPAYCQIMSMHWDVNDRETVRCGDRECPQTQAECAGQTFTYHGHEVVAEVRQFLQFPTHFFAECQAVNAYENTVPDEAWPFLDDEDRVGHFLTTEGNPPSCPCTDAEFECVVGGCDDGTRDCCLPRDVKELGAGFMIAAAPAAADVRILSPEIPYNQMDGAFGPVGGSEQAYNLSTYLGTAYKNDRDVTFITGPNGPGDQDVWMTGFVDGVCDIGEDEFNPVGECTFGKVSYLGGHKYDPVVPLSEHATSQGARLFLNALFEADCVTAAGQPALRLSWAGEATLAVQSLPAEATYTVYYSNEGQGTAVDSVLTVAPGPSEVVESEEGATAENGNLYWDLGSIGSATGGASDPPSGGSRWATLRFNEYGEHELAASIAYLVGATPLETPLAMMTIRVVADGDGDGVGDESDPAPEDAHVCGDSDADGCDDCSISGHRDPAGDGCEAADGGPDGGDGGGDGGGDDGCGCQAATPAPWAAEVLALLGF